MTGFSMKNLFNLCLVVTFVFLSLNIHAQDTNYLNLLNLPLGVRSGKYYHWDANNKKLTFTKSVHFSKENPDQQDDDLDGFYWDVPTHVKTIVINKNVTITGGFRASGDLKITGKSKKTSVIFGTNTMRWALGPNGYNESTPPIVGGDDRTHDKMKWSYSAISSANYNDNFNINVENLTIKNSRTYAITTPKSLLFVSNVNIVNTRPQLYGVKDSNSNSDGIAGGQGTIIQNSYIDTWDDAIKLYENTTIRNTTIVYNQNGAPFQMGWGSSDKETFHVLDSVKIINSKYRGLIIRYSTKPYFLQVGATQEENQILSLKEVDSNLTSQTKTNSNFGILP